MSAVTAWIPASNCQNSLPKSLLAENVLLPEQMLAGWSRKGVCGHLYAGAALNGDVYGFFATTISCFEELTFRQASAENSLVYVFFSFLIYE